MAFIYMIMIIILVCATFNNGDCAVCICGDEHNLRWAAHVVLGVITTPPLSFYFSRFSAVQLTSDARDDGTSCAVGLTE